MTFRIALCQVRDVDDDFGPFAQQLGLTSVNITFPDIPLEKGYYEVDDLVALRERCEQYGLTLEVIENVSHTILHPIIRGLPGRDEALDNLSTTIRNMGMAGIPMLGYHFMPNGVWRTNMHQQLRGGATASAFDESLVHLGNDSPWPKEDTGWDGDPDHLVITHEQMWDNYRYFLDRILPVAETAGVLLAQHPDDPPIRQVDGIARIFTSPAAFVRGLELANGGPAWGIDLCLGTVSEMAGAQSVHEMIETFGPQGCIRYVHFRDVEGTVPSFVETWLGEGNYDPVEVIRHLKRVGFTGWLQDDHVPHMTGDTFYSHRGRAHEIGFMKGVMAAVG